jgi:hypothetical protein
MVLLYPPTPTTQPLPNVQLTDLQQVQLFLATVVQNHIAAHCTETCETQIVVLMKCL